MGHSTKIGVKKQNEKILRLSEANASTPWFSKTPKTVHGVESQSEYLDRRIKRHHSSSPGTIVEALKSLSKGTKAMMRENALLRFENRDPRRANETLSRRRRAKRARLQKRGRMTVEQGRAAIDQIDVDTQIVAESSRSGGQGESARPKERRYGACSKTECNVRNCEIIV
jgi:hypothetical protein